MSQWLRWTDAIALSAALDGGPATAAPASARPPASAEEAEVARVRAALTKAVADERTGTTSPDPEPDFAVYRRRYLTRQQAMETSIGPLRARLRATLAARSAAMARLAALDAVMEHALGPRERALLASVPRLLEPHFGRLRQQADPASPAAGLKVFSDDMHAVLLAELDIRLQPVEGLLDALRAG